MTVAAVDLGASSGRVMAGRVSDAGVTLREVHRFGNEPVSAGGTLYWDILRLLASALTQREIGAELYLSLNTIKTHTRNIYLKLGAGSRDEAVARARELGLL